VLGAQSVFSGVVVVARFDAILHDLKIAVGAYSRSANYSFDLPSPNFTRDTLDDVNGNDFCHDSRFFWLVNCSKMGVVFLRNDIGIPSESFFAQMERFLASLRVQSYNAKKRIPNFSQICGVSKC